MNRISDLKVAVAIIRVVTALSGIMCTSIAMFFTTSWWAVFSILVAGSAIIATLDDVIKYNSKSHV